MANNTRCNDAKQDIGFFCRMNFKSNVGCCKIFSYYLSGFVENSSGSKEPISDEEFERAEQLAFKESERAKDLAQEKSERAIYFFI